MTHPLFSQLIGAPYRIVRPAIVEDVPGVRAWLRAHADGGWLQCDDEARVRAARRLLFISWLRVRGVLSDDAGAY